MPCTGMYACIYMCVYVYAHEYCIHLLTCTCTRDRLQKPYRCVVNAALDRCPAAGWTAENCALQPPPLYYPGTCVHVNVYACMHIHVCVCVCVCVLHIHIYLLCCLISTRDTLYHVLRGFTIIYDPLHSAFWYTRTFSGRLKANIFLARS